MASGFLASLLRVDRAGEGEFTARLHDFEGVSFGGDALGRIALAAAQTAGDRRLHALHASFLRPVPPGVAVTIRVESLGEGRTLARRRVAIEHERRLLCHATASFAVAAAVGPRWQEVEAPRVPAPETLPPDTEVAREEGWTWDLEHEEFAWGFVERPWRAWEHGEPASDSRWCTWMKPRDPLPDDPHVHAAALAYVSDLLSHWSTCRRLGRDHGPGFYVSLDHALHVHCPMAWNDWWLLDSRSEVAHDGRALWQRRIFTRDGALIASIQQEGLIREPSSPA